MNAEPTGPRWWLSVRIAAALVWAAMGASDALWKLLFGWPAGLEGLRRA